MATKDKVKPKAKPTLVEKISNAKEKVRKDQAEKKRKVVMHEIICPKCQGLKIKDGRTFKIYTKRIKDGGGKV